MKKIGSWILALCMLFSAASAETQFSTEALLTRIVEEILDNGAFWLDYANDRTQLAGGVTMDENGLPGFGLRIQQDGTDIYAALNAQGMRVSDGTETISATWEELMGASGMSAASPRLTQEDAELLGVVLGEIVQPVLQTVQMNVTNAQLDGKPAQCTEIRMPLREACAALNQSVPAALNAHADELNLLIYRNQEFLRSLGVPAYSVQSMVYGWWDLKVAELCPDDTAIVIRWTEGADAWKLGVSVGDLGLDAHFDGVHVDGRIYTATQEWSFDTRDLVMLMQWVHELFLQISPDAFDFSFTQDRGSTHLSLKTDAAKLLTQLGNNVKNVLDRHSEQAQALIDRYAPLFGVDAGVSVEELGQALQQKLIRLSFNWSWFSKYLFGADSTAVDVDFYTADGNTSLRVKSPLIRADVTVDGDGLDMDAGVNINRHWYEVTAHGLWNADNLQLNGTMGMDGEVATRWGLNGVVENEACVFSLTVNSEWLGTATLREGSVEVSTSAGWQGSLLWSSRGASLHAVYGEEIVDASVRLLDGQLSAQMSASGFSGSLLVREENGGGRVRLQWETLHSRNHAELFELEGAVTDEQVMFKAGNYLKSRYEEMTIWEVSADIRENRAGGTLHTRDTQASFQWSPGMLSAQSLYRMPDLTVDTNLLVTDITIPGTADANTTQISWKQLLQYTDETVDNRRLYTVHTTLGDETLYVDVVDQDGRHAKGTLVLLQEPADPIELLGLDETQPVPTAAPEMPSAPNTEPEPTKKPVGGVFLTKP